MEENEGGVRIKSNGSSQTEGEKHESKEDADKTFLEARHNVENQDKYYKNVNPVHSAPSQCSYSTTAEGG